MFREIVKDVYIGKSQLGIWVNGKRVPKETLVKDIPYQPYWEINCQIMVP